MTEDSGFTVQINLEGLKKMAAHLLKELPTLNSEELENAQKCFNLGYLGMIEERPKVDSVLAAGLFEYVNVKCLEREVQLIFTPENEV